MVAASKLIGSAGEHFVMSALLRQGFIAALAPEGAPNIDILVSNLEGARQCSIQVKSRSGRGSDGGWHMRPKHEKLVSEHLFYCFVDFSEGSDTLDQAPDVYILPSRVVAGAIAETHKVWLRNPGKNGHIRKDNPVRRLLPDYTKICSPEFTQYGKGWLTQYKNAWGLINNHITAPEKATQ